MATSKKTAPNAAAWIAGGEAHQPEYKAKAKVSSAKVKQAEAAAVTGGRPKTFDEPTARFNFFLPASLVRSLKMDALDQGKTASEIVAEVLQAHYQKRAKAKS